MDERWAHLLSQLRERFPADADVTDVEALADEQLDDLEDVDLSPTAAAAEEAQEQIGPLADAELDLELED